MPNPHSIMCKYVNKQLPVQRLITNVMKVRYIVVNRYNLKIINKVQTVQRIPPTEYTPMGRILQTKHPLTKYKLHI